MVFCSFHHALKGPPTDWWFGKIWFSEVGKIKKRLQILGLEWYTFLGSPPSSFRKKWGAQPPPGQSKWRPKDEGLTGFDSPSTWGYPSLGPYGSNHRNGEWLSRKLNTHVEEVTPQSMIWEYDWMPIGHFVTSKNQGNPPICSEEAQLRQGKVVTWGNPFSGGDSSAVQELFLTCKLMPMIRQDGSHLPSWELTNALKSPFGRWLSFSPGGIC